MKATMLAAAVLAATAALSAQGDPTWTQPFEPQRIADNLYFVGTRGLSSFLLVTREGNILIDTGLEESVPLVRANIEKLGFKIADIKIMLSSHTHFDHVAGHAEMQRLTGATIMALGEDAAALSSGTDNSALGARGWKPAKVGRVLKDLDTVSLGGVTLTAHHTPGHTKGCTAWTTTVTDTGQTYNVVFVGCASINQGVKLLGNTRHPTIVGDYARTFKVLKELRADIFLAQHPSMFRLEDKVKRLKPGAPNPFVDPQGYRDFVAGQERNYLTQLERERSGGAR
jgi:metallo-beta-lactamase class B